jgi:glycosyltransferase involved in cell wall biosynthesis
MSYESHRKLFASDLLDVSIVVPFFNEEESLRPLFDRIAAALLPSATRYEIIFVDDGSTDLGGDVCRHLAEEHDHVRLIEFRRNFGKSAALSAGFRFATGKNVITMDADLQDDPEEIPRFLEALAGGADVVCGWKQTRLDPASKTWPSKLFNAVVNRTFGLSLQDHNCGFKAYRAEALAHLNLYGEQHRFIPALLHARGYRLVELAVRHHPRQFGSSKFGASRLVKGALDLLTVAMTTRYAARPLHLFGLAGLCLFVVGGLALAYLAALWMLGDGPIGSRPLLTFGVLAVLFGGQLIGTGLIGELFLSRSIDEGSKYDIRATAGLIEPMAVARTTHLET